MNHPMLEALRRLGGSVPWSLAARCGCSLIVLAWIGSRLDWGRLAGAFRSLIWGHWLASLALFVGCQLLCSLRWQMLSRPLGFALPFGRFAKIYFVGMFFNLMLPTAVGGDAVRAVYLARGSGRKWAAVLSVLLDRASGLLVLLALACLSDLVSPVPLPWQARALIWGTGLTAGLGLAMLPRLTRSARHLPSAKLRGLADSFRRAADVYRDHWPVVARTTGLSVIGQALNVVLVWQIGLALRLDVPLAYYGIAYPIVTLLTMLPVSLNGMGVREGGMVVVMGAAGVAAPDAVALAFLWFCVQTAAGLGGAGVYLFGRFPRTEVTGDDALGGHPAQGRARQLEAVA